MENKKEKHIDIAKSLMYEPIYVKWKKQIFATFIFSWVAVLLIEIIAGITVFQSGGDMSITYLLKRVVLPSGLDAIILAVMSFGLFSGKVSESAKNIIILSGLVLIASVISIAHNSFSLIRISLCLPVLAVPAFMNKKLLNGITAESILMTFIVIPFIMLIEGDTSTEFVTNQFINATLSLVFLVISYFISYLIIAIHGEKEKVFYYEQKENRLLTEQIKVDGLTGAYNHTAFYSDLESVVKSNRDRDFPTPLCLAVIDIDDFKSFNDSFGHMKGDEVLKTVSNIMVSNIINKGLLYRYGGDEFVIIFKATKDESLYALEKIRESVGSTDAGEGVKITLSIGFCEINSMSVTAEQMFYRADQALYKAKFSGKNRIEIAE